MRASQPSPGRFYLLPLIAIASGGSGGPSGVRPGAWREIGDATVRLEYQDADAGISATMLEHARAGRAAAMAFFGESFATGVSMRIFPDRASLTACWHSARRLRGSRVGGRVH